MQADVLTNIATTVTVRELAHDLCWLFADSGLGCAVGGNCNYFFEGEGQVAEIIQGQGLGSLLRRRRAGGELIWNI